MVSIGTDTIHTACSCTKDTAEDEVCLFVIFRQNLESSTIDGDGAIAIERIIDFYIACMSTSHTTAIKFGDNNTVVVLETIAILVFRILGV